ncbi:MAG: hypothetical protein ACRD22_16660, partial [Terriglobia bacterium]
MQHELDIPRDSFRLARIEQSDACSRSDNLMLFREQILRNEESYPGIGKWLDGKVLNGMKSGERVGFVGLLNDRPIAAAVVKKGATAKFCHLKLEQEAQSRHLGDLFFMLMTLELRHGTNAVRFTLPESLWEEKGAFFKSFSFHTATRSLRQYRKADTELFCQSSFQSLFRALRLKLPSILGSFTIRDHSLLTGAVLALQPKPLEKIFSGEKTVEIRTRFSSNWEGQRVSLYATRPLSCLAGEARIGQVTKDRPERIWDQFGHLLGCDHAEFQSYVGTRAEVFAITLHDIKPYREEVPISQLSYLLGTHLSAPQSYLSLANNDQWSSAVVL